MKRALLLTAAAAGVAWVLAGCATPTPNGITQVATIDALLAGVYDGHISLEDLRRHGDFGIGTFEGLDGEMILLGGAFHQVRADGKVYRPGLHTRTPFACVTRFVPDRQAAIQEPMTMKGMEDRINSLAPQTNSFCAFAVHGLFNHIRVRSVPAQRKPYPPLVEVTRNQPVFDRVSIRGTVMGFRSPPFVKGVNVPGFHMHFLADDLSSGGHVLEFELAEGQLEADTIHDWLSVYLPPDSASFGSADLSQDRSAQLNTAEK